MKNIVITCLSLAVLGLVSCKDEKKETSDTPSEITETNQEDVNTMKKEEGKIVSFELEPKSDTKATGKVSFRELNGNVSMKALVTGLEPGNHAIHIHEKADCTSPDGKSSGGHWNPTFEDHGKWGDEKGFHRGDIGNFVANDKGEGTISITTDLWCIGCDDPNKDILGKAIIVHQGEDDFTSQPSGDAGARVSCGGIIE